MKYTTRLLRFGLSLGFIGAATASHAQSSVALYGIIDTGLIFNNNSHGHPTYAQTSGVISGNRWGFIGSEDLGGGLRAIFLLESGFSLSNGSLGQNGRMFGRQDYVGVSSESFGTVTVGRQYMTNIDYLTKIAVPYMAWGSPYDNDNLNNAYRAGNSVKFQSLNYGGFKFAALYGFSNSSNFTDSRVYSFSALYARNGFTVATNYLQLDNPGSSTNPGGSVASGDATMYAGRQRTMGIGTSYVLGNATVGLTYTQTNLSDATAIATYAAGTTKNFPLTSSSVSFRNYAINGSYRLTPAILFAGSYTYTQAHLNGVSPKYNQIATMADYALSKRTDIYEQVAWQHVSGAGNSGITADLQGFGASSTNSQLVVTLGFRHRF